MKVGSLIFLTALLLSRPALADAWGDAMQEYRAGHFEAAFKLVTPLAKAGNAEAQYVLSNMYWYGEGTEVDYDESMKWARQSAALGNADGENAVAVSYAFGKGVAPDPVEALKWFKIAADNGSAKAQVSLARRYLDGEDVPKDEALGRRYLSAAVAQGYFQAQYALAVYTAAGRYGIAPDAKESLRLMTLAAEQRYVVAEFSLALAYGDDKSAVHDPIKAATWATIAANAGCQYATVILKPMITAGLKLDDRDEANRQAALWEQNHPRPTFQEDVESDCRIRPLTSTLPAVTT